MKEEGVSKKERKTREIKIISVNKRTAGRTTQTDDANYNAIINYAHII